VPPGGGRPDRCGTDLSQTLSIGLNFELPPGSTPGFVTAVLPLKTRSSATEAHYAKDFGGGKTATAVISFDAKGNGVVRGSVTGFENIGSQSFQGECRGSQLLLEGTYTASNRPFWASLYFWEVK
jgi:hypothetical protein